LRRINYIQQLVIFTSPLRLRCS